MTNIRFERATIESFGCIRLRVLECIRVWEGYDSEFLRHTTVSSGVYQSLGGLRLRVSEAYDLMKQMRMMSAH